MEEEDGDTADTENDTARNEFGGGEGGGVEGGGEEEDVHFDVSFEEEDAAEPAAPLLSILGQVTAGQCFPLRSPEELVRFCEALPRDDPPNEGPAVEPSSLTLAPNPNP